MAGLALGGGTEERGDVVLPFDIGLVREIEITAVGLRFACERGLQVVVGLGAFQRLHVSSFEGLREKLLGAIPA
jgi:hypothetical protein